MLFSCWSVKGGSGTSVVSAALALALARTSDHDVLLVDLAGDAPAVLGVSSAPDVGVADWLAAGADVPADALGRLEVPVAPGVALLPRGARAMAPHDRFAVLVQILAGDARAVVVDCGQVVGPAGCLTANELGLELAQCATRSLLVTRACYLALSRVASVPMRPSGVVLVVEPGRALGAPDVEHVVGAPVVAEVNIDPAVARAVDAGLLTRRLPRALERSLRRAV